MNFSFLHKYSGLYVEGTFTTLFLSLFGVTFGVLLGVLLALMKLSKNKLLKGFSTAYIELVRGTPLLVQLYIIYYGLPWVTKVDFNDITLGIIAVSLNSAAYVAEIIRAGILSIDKGQMEAARSLGMSHNLTMANIIIPQAIKNILPALGNEFITLVKESSIVSVVGIHELMYNADTVRGNTYLPFEPLIVAALVYFTITFVLSKLLGLLERRLRTGDTSK